MSVASIKADHDRVFRLLDDLSNRIHAEEQLDAEERRRCALELVDYCTDHFREEELDMRGFNYPELERHLREHERIQDHLIKGAIARIIQSDSLVLLDCVRDLFIRHIITWDEAFLVWEKEQHQSVRPGVD